MKGTEKQISWAQQIISDRKVMANAFVNKRGYWSGAMVDFPEFDLDAVTAMLDGFDDASEIINNRNESLINLYIKHIDWKASEKKINTSDDPFAL